MSNQQLVLLFIMNYGSVAEKIDGKKSNCKKKIKSGLKSSQLGII